VYYATGSAAVFAEGAVAHLNALNCVDTLCFGCETDEDACAHLWYLEQAADVLLQEPPLFKQKLAEALKTGISYPAAQSLALESFLDVPDLLSMPNNILALEYMKALKKRHSPIQPYPVPRKGEGYHSQNAFTDFASASAIRQVCDTASSIAEVPWDGIPEGTRQVIEIGFKKQLPVYQNDFSAMFAMAFLRSSASLEDYMDITPDIARRMEEQFKSYKSLTSFLMDVKNKSWTYSRLCRCASHILLGIRKDMLEAAKADNYAYYARILGFRKQSEPLLKEIKKKSSLPMIGKMAGWQKALEGNGRRMMAADIDAAECYRTAVQIKFGHVLKNEFNQQLIIL
jgi:predicted nucleotidyltransferase